MKLAWTLIDAMVADAVDLSKYADRYAEQVRQVVEAKGTVTHVVEVAPAEEAAPASINLMDALQKSLEDATPKAAAQKPPKLAAPGTAAKAAGSR